MRFKNRKTFALLVLLTFLFTSLFSSNLMGGARVAEATMGEDCAQIAERITEKDLVTPHWFDKFCINHIDITANLVATVYVDGEPYQEVVHLTPADAKYVEITAMRNGHPVAFEKSDISVYSVDMFGNAQIRVNGIFPIGTKADPVVYTVKITKPVTVDTVYGEMTVPVTFLVQTHYWDLLNACPALTVLRGEWAKGFFILGSGIDIMLGGGSAEAEPVCGNLTIQKVINGLKLDEEKNYLFDIIDEDGNLYRTVEVEVPKYTSSVTLLNIPYGTYTVEERAEGLDIDGYNLVSVEYSTENGEVTVCKADKHPKVVVTNTYASEEVPDRVTDAEVAIVKEKVEFATNNVGEAVSEEKQQAVRDLTFGFDVAAAVVGEDTLFASFEEAQQAAAISDLTVTQFDVENNGATVDVAATLNNNYYFRLDTKAEEQLNLDMEVNTTTNAAYIWLFVNEDETIADVDGLEWKCEIYRDGVKVADGNQLFAKLTTNSVYQFVNTYKLADTTTPGGSGGNNGGGTTTPEPNEPGGGSGGTTTPNPDENTTGGTDSEEPVVTPDEEPAVVTPGEEVAPEEVLAVDVPKTGDNTQVVFYALLMLAAAAGLVALKAPKRNR